MKQVIVCVNHRTNPSQPSCGGRGGGEPLAELLERAIADRGLGIEVERFYCLGQCAQGPNIKLSPNGPFLRGMTAERLDEMLDEIEAFVRGGD